MRALLIAAAVILWPILALGEITGPARVIDGDTIEVAGERIRLHGIDVPEMDQTCKWPDSTIACGAIAKAELADAIAGAEVRCEERDRDRYGRIVAVCHASGHDIGRAMVDAGWALAYRRFSTVNRLPAYPRHSACECQRRSKIGPKGGVKLVHFL